MSALNALQDWYQAQCNGDWEDLYGISIDSLDMGGWALSIDLQETALAKRPFEAINLNPKSKSEWLRCSVVKQQFRGECAPLMLHALIKTFTHWAKA